MSRPPDFRELVGDDVPEREAERLRRAHDLLVAAGPPPELPPSLAGVPGVERPAERSARVLGLPPRRRGRVLAFAGSLAAATLLIGFVFGQNREQFDVDFTVPMHGTQAAPRASAVIEVGEIDEAGNWPLRLKVSGLEELPEGGYYELYLTRGRKVVASCGTFRVSAGTAEVRMNAPYRFDRFDGWVVTVQLPGQKKDPGPRLLTT